MASLLHHRTPTLLGVDPRGLSLSTVNYHRRDADTQADSRIERQEFDVAGRFTRQWDARLWAGGQEDAAPNQCTVFSMSGRALHCRSVDSGWRMMLPGGAGKALESWDGRGMHQQTVYDAQLRPVAIHEQVAGEPPLCVERLIYGGDVEAPTNRAGQLLRHDDPAGSLHVGGYGLLGQPSAQTQRFLHGLVKPDWPESQAARDALLEFDGQGMAVSYTTRWAYDAQGEPVLQTDADGNDQSTRYDVAGLLRQSSLKGVDEADFTVVFEALDYDVFGQVSLQKAGNGVITTTRHSGVDYRLHQMQARRPDKLLQDFRYFYDPVGNVLGIDDAAQPTDWFNGEEINPASTYRYDTLYQLIEVHGRESVQAGIQPGLPFPVLPGGGDASRQRNYTQTYTYDKGGNLLTLAHTQTAPRNMKVDRLSNRALLMPDESHPPDIDKGFDANGNLLALDMAQVLSWDARNQLQRVTQIVRKDGTPDDEVYVYSGDGQRRRKVCRQQAAAVTHTAQVKYLPGLEIRTNTATGEVLHVVTVQTGHGSVRRLLWYASRKVLPLAQWRYGIDDHLRSCSLELDSEANVVTYEGYYPYGGTAWWAARNDMDAKFKTIRYSGKERDGTGLYYYGFRYYAPWLQRWINPDPAGDIDGLNLFGFVRNNPIIHIDTDGRGLEQIPSLVLTHLLRWAEQNYRSMPTDEWRKEVRDRIRPHVPTGKDELVDQIQHMARHAVVQAAISPNSGASSSRPSSTRARGPSTAASGTDVKERAHQLMWKSNYRVFQAAAESMLSNSTSQFSATFDSGTLDTIRGFHGAQGIFDSPKGKEKGPLKDAVKSLLKSPPIDVAWSFNTMLIADARESDTRLYRGTAMSPDGFNDLRRMTANGGTLLQSTRFVATSSDIDVARRFSRMDVGVPVLFQVRGWAQSMGSEAAESEHLFPYGSVFLVEPLASHEFRMTYKKAGRPSGPLPH